MASSGQRVSSLIYRASPSPSPLSSPYICTSCRSVSHHQQSISGRALPSRSRPLSSSCAARDRRRKENLPFTEKLRRKIWGTDNPPGLADPYGGPSFLERHWAQREQRYRDKDDALAQRDALEAAERELQLEEEERLREQQQQQQQHGQGHGVSSTPRPARPTSAPRVEASADAISQHQPEAEAAAEPGEYTPATTWDGLMHIGHTGHWQDIAPTEQDAYQPWFVKSSASTPAEVHAASREDVEGLFREAAANAGIDLAGEGVASQPLDLASPATFEILKAFRALTHGFTFPDALLSSLSATPATYADLITYYLDATVNATTPAASTSVYDALVATPDLAAQPNVLIFPRRETPVDKEKEVGRWKVIEKELTDRGLPVLGRLSSSS